MGLFPENWPEQLPWTCPECGKVIYVYSTDDALGWEMCSVCEAKFKAERLAYEHTKEIAKNNMIITNGLEKPRYRYNWKTGKAELVE